MLSMKTLKIKKVSYTVAKKYLLQSKITNQASHIREDVQKIILNVKKNGDKALINISNKIDKTEFKTISEASFNKSDLKEIPNVITDKLEIIPVEWIDEVILHSLESQPKAINKSSSFKSKVKKATKSVSKH